MTMSINASSLCPFEAVGFRFLNGLNPQEAVHPVRNCPAGGLCQVQYPGTCTGRWGVCVTVCACVCPRMLVFLCAHVCIRVPARPCSIPKGKSTEVPVRTPPLTQYPFPFSGGIGLF